MPPFLDIHFFLTTNWKVMPCLEDAGLIAVSVKDCL